MNFGTLYSGIGGADAGLCAAGWSCVFQAESHPYRQSVLSIRFPKAKLYSNVSVVGIHNVDLIYAELPDADIWNWWPSVGHTAFSIRPQWLVIECSPSVSPTPIIRDLALADWWFRLVQVGIRISTPSLPREDQHIRQRLYIIASHSRTAVDGLRLHGFSADMEVDVGPVPFPRDTFEFFECSMGLKSTWSCVCNSKPCACSREQRVNALREATPPHLAMWLAYLIDGRWSSDQSTIEMG